MARKTFLIFWLLALIPIILMGSGFYLYARSTTSSTVPLFPILGAVILAALLLAVIFRLASTRLFKPIQHLNQIASTLAQKSAKDDQSAQTAVESDRAPSYDETISLEKSLNQIAVNWQELESLAREQFSSYQSCLLAMNQFASRTAGTDEKPLIRQALEIAIKHLDCAYMAYFEKAAADAAADPAAAGSHPNNFSLRQVALIEADPASGVKFHTTETQRDILQKALNTSQPQIINQPDPDQHGYIAPITEIAIPIITFGMVKGVLLAGYRNQALGRLDARISQTTDHLRDSVPFAQIQVLAALTGLALTAQQAIRDHQPGREKQPAPIINAANLSTELSEGADALSNAAILRRLAEYESLWKISQAISAETDLLSLYRLIHQQLTQIMGELNSFAIVLYERAIDQVQIPYLVEDGQLITVPSFPLGEGLSSIVIRSGQPLLLTHNITDQARALGAILIGEPAKSWLGVPLTLAGETFGLMIVQDIHYEGRFDAEDQRLLSLIAAQVAVVVRNTRLLGETRRQSISQNQLIEITDKIRRSVEMQTILKTTVDELAAALNARKATIRLFTDMGNGDQLQDNTHDKTENSAETVSAGADQAEAGV